MKKTEIKRIHYIFTHNNKSYILFDIHDSHYNYLYFFNPENQNRSLLYGKDLVLSISKYSRDPSIKCLECYLGSHILGAVSLDNGDIAQSNLSLEEANRILEKLKEMVTQQRELIQLF